MQLFLDRLDVLGVGGAGAILRRRRHDHGEHGRILDELHLAAASSRFESRRIG